MGFDPPRYLRGGLVHCAGIGLINKILGQLRFQWKTRVVEGDVDGAIAEIFCSMCVFHSGNLFQSPQAIRRAPRRAASDRSQAPSEEASDRSREEHDERQRDENERQRRRDQVRRLRSARQEDRPER